MKSKTRSVNYKDVRVLVRYAKLPDLFTEGRQTVVAKDVKYGDMALFTNEYGLAHAAVVLGRSPNGKVCLLQKINQFKPYAVTEVDDKALKPFGDVQYWQKK